MRYSAHAIALLLAATSLAPAEIAAAETKLVFVNGGKIIRNGEATDTVYEGTQDTILMFDHKQVANNWKYTSESISADWSQITRNRDEQGLIRFDDIFGEADTQIPPKAKIVEAKLTLTARNPSPSNVQLHRVLIDWQEATTKWSNFGNGNKAGVDVDGSEATEEFIVAPGNTFTVDIAKFVQAWADGEDNYGVVLYHTATSRNGVDWWSSEAGEAAGQPNLDVRPRLEVTFLPQ